MVDNTSKCKSEFRGRSSGRPSGSKSLTGRGNGGAGLKYEGGLHKQARVGEREGFWKEGFCR